MTTSVTVSAHCGSNKQVRIVCSGDHRGPADTVIQDGQTYQGWVYDDLLISVKEELKPEEA